VTALSHSTKPQLSISADRRVQPPPPELVVPPLPLITQAAICVTHFKLSTVNFDI
jgi:hypothetical protein